MGLFGKKKRDLPVQTPDMNALPKHIAIIMDGNGRWAKQRHLPRTAGHSVGSETFRKIATYCNDIGVKYLTVYAFSTENWSRPQAEVTAIMGLLRQYVLEAIDSVEKDNIHLRFWGDRSRIAPELLELMEHAEKKSERMTGIFVNVCLNYGGRDEITKAVQKLAESVKAGSLAPQDITAELIGEHLYSAGTPDPDLIIRPSGEIRTSNFLLWQSAYSEYYFTDVLWPDFDERELDRAIVSFQSRSRRFGGVDAKK
ncbi:MAG: isoprenyl transferase [Oscillospiraceae bacterium]|nr:isoprenyl transferase [Oscillospiraceae bacterium]